MEEHPNSVNYTEGSFLFLCVVGCVMEKVNRKRQEIVKKKETEKEEEGRGRKKRKKLRIFLG